MLSFTMKSLRLILGLLWWIRALSFSFCFRMCVSLNVSDDEDFLDWLDCTDKFFGSLSLDGVCFFLGFFSCDRFALLAN